MSERTLPEEARYWVLEDRQSIYPPDAPLSEAADLIARLADAVEQLQARVVELEGALNNCAMMARRKRARYHYYDEQGAFTGLGEHKSGDADWDHVARFCDEVGIHSTILREEKEQGE